MFLKLKNLVLVMTERVVKWFQTKPEIVKLFFAYSFGFIKSMWYVSTGLLTQIYSHSSKFLDSQNYSPYWFFSHCPDREKKDSFRTKYFVHNFIINHKVINSKVLQQFFHFLVGFYWILIMKAKVMDFSFHLLFNRERKCKF